MNRREFTRLLGLGIVGAAAPVGARSLLDLPGGNLNDAKHRFADLSAVPEDGLLQPCEPERVVTHWRVARNKSWQWFEESQLVAGKWRLTGMTMPVSRKTGYRISGRDCANYLFDSQVPEAVIEAAAADSVGVCIVGKGAAAGPAATAERRAQDGRPTSYWLSNLDCGELHTWLASFEPPQADVAGMTFFEHLTRDHGFSSDAIACLTEAEQAKLHGAAHAGY